MAQKLRPGSKYTTLRAEVQGEHKVFPWLQTFITRNLRWIQTYFFFTIT